MSKRLATLALLLAAVPALAKPPRLTLFIAVDSMGSDVFLRTRPRFKAGFAQVLAQGALFPTARYSYAKTVTAAGHATLATGANPWRHGVVGNAIFNRSLGKVEPVFVDPSHPVLEAPLGNDDVSPVNLLAETLSDRLRIATQGRGKSIAMATKGRAAIALGGKLGSTFWFNEQVGKFVTGTYYAKEFPSWVKAFNDRKVPDSYFSKDWTLIAPQREYVGEDDRPFELDYLGQGRTFPHSLKGGLPSPGPQFYSSLVASPFGNELLVQLSKAAIDAEGLGRDEVPDLLSVSFSATDRIFHHFGPYSWETQDVLVRLDRSIGELIAHATKVAGKGNLLVVISADHGGAPIPEELNAAGMPAERISPDALKKALSAELQTRFGGSDLISFLDFGEVFLNAKALADRKLDGAAIRRATAQWLGRQSGVAFAVARDDLSGPDQGPGFLKSLRLSYSPDRSGDVLFVLKPYRLLDDDTERTSHGTPYSYDAEVPVLFYGKGIRPGLYRQVIDPADVAPTIASLLEIGSPAMCEGTVREAVLGVGK